MKKELIETSKFLSYILRHEPQSIGLKLDDEGWASIDELINCANRSGNFLKKELIEEVVIENDKKRFTLSEDGNHIRAAQGHSLKNIQISYPEMIPPLYLYHGTAERFLESILHQGLQPQERQYIHLSESKETALLVGKRYGKPVLLRIETKRMRDQSFKFYLAENGVWLTTQIPPLFFSIEEK